MERGDMSVKWGVIGAGGIADRRTIPEGLMPAENAELVAVMDVDEERVKQVAQKYDCYAHLSSPPASLDGSYGPKTHPLRKTYGNECKRSRGNDNRLPRQ
jgi:hypothetical protein